MTNTSFNPDLFVSNISKECDILMGALYSVFFIMSLQGNCILLLVAYHQRASLKPAEYLIINLSISDLGMTFSLFPLAIPSSFYHRWLFGEVACQLYAMCGVLFGLCSLTNLTALSLVCCLKVCFPNQGSKFSSSHARLLVFAVWCYSMVFAVGPLVQWGHYSAEPYGTACCIDWHAPNHELLALSYIVCLFVFCYALPCTFIVLSYTFILLTVRGSRQAVQQHVSPKNKTTNAHALIVKLSVAVCLGFLVAWTPYAAVSMWAALTEATQVPPTAFALAAMFAKSSTIYNPLVHLLCKPNFRESLYRDLSAFLQRIYRGSPRSNPKESDFGNLGSHSQSNNNMGSTAHVTQRQQNNCGLCPHCSDNVSQCKTSPTSYRTVWSGSSCREEAV